MQYFVFQSIFTAGHKKKLKKKSFKNSKVQLKLQICVNNKCKSARFDIKLERIVHQTEVGIVMWILFINLSVRSDLSMLWIISRKSRQTRPAWVSVIFPPDCSWLTVSAGSITLLSGHGIVQTCTAGGLIHLGPGEHVSIYVQVTGHIFLLAGSHFSGVMIGWSVYNKLTLFY